MYLNNSQSYIFAIILTFVVGFVACEKSSIGNNPTSQTLSLRLNEDKSITFDHSSTLNIKIKNINDSRCPENANCVTAGEVIVDFVAKEDNDSLAISLAIPKSTQNQNTTTFKLNGHQYQAILKEVTPYPNLSMNSTDPSIATFMMSRLE